jgi:hypothetical protein
MEVRQMKTIGIRATPKSVTFAVFDTDLQVLVNVEEIKIPAAFSKPAALKYLRSNLLDVLREYGIERAGVRVTESNAQTPSIDRIQIEGVIQEAFASSELKSYYVGQVSSISKRLNIKSAEFKPMISGGVDPGV